MKQTIYIWVLYILGSCSNQKEQKGINLEVNPKAKIVEKSTTTIDTARIDKYATELKDWLNYYEKYSLKVENFAFIRQDYLPNITATIDSFDASNDIYKPFYKYSVDSSKILDLISHNLSLEINERNELVSYGGDFDSEVSIKDLKKKLWKRLLFVGSPYIIEDGFWINNHQLLIVGEFSETDHKNYKPHIWFVDLKANIIQTFEYKNYIGNMNCNYLEKVIYKDIKMIK